MTTQTSADPSARVQRELAAHVRGAVLTPSDPDYGGARAGFDTSQQHEPSIIVEAATVSDVASALASADRHQMPVAVQATGHGTTATMRRGMLINTRRLTAVTVDVDRRLARVQAGATWADVLASTTPYGLAPLCGAAPGVGAVGYLLGGGLGPLGRRYGFGADRVESMTMLTVSGEQVQVSAQSEPELFWGIRGAGANFGVVTEVEIELEPIAQVYGGGLFFPGAAGADVLAAFTQTIRSIPDELTLSVALVTFPPLPAVPPPLRGTFTCHVRVCHLGAMDEAEEHLRTLRHSATAFLDTVTDLPVSSIGSIHADPVAPMPVNCRSHVLRRFDADAAAVVTDRMSAHTPFMIEIRHLGGALARTPRPDNAVGHRTGAVNLFSSAYPGTEPDTTGKAQQDLIDALSSYSDGGAHLNFLQGSHVTAKDVRRAFTEPTWRRLVQLKQQWDPDNRLSCNTNIAPGDRCGT